MGQHKTNTENKPEVTNPIYQESFHIGKNRSRTGVPEADQQIGNQTYSLPTKEQLHEIVAHHQHQH